MSGSSSTSSSSGKLTGSKRWELGDLCAAVLHSCTQHRNVWRRRAVSLESRPSCSKSGPPPRHIPVSRRRVLAVSPDLEQLRRIVASLERAGAEVDAVRSPIAVEQPIIPHRYIFYSIPDGNYEDVERHLSRMRQKAHVAVVVPDAKLTDLTRLLSERRINHVIVGEELEQGVF